MRTGPGTEQETRSRAMRQGTEDVRQGPIHKSGGDRGMGDRG